MKRKNIFVTSDIWFNRPIGEFSSMTNEEYNNMIIDNDDLNIFPYISFWEKM